MTMTLISKASKCLFILACGVMPGVLLAQDSVSLSVSPTLFEMSAEPGKTWQSAIRVINTNPFELELEAEVVNFAPRDEGGAATFLPLLDDEASADTLAAWINIGDRTSFVVPAEQTVSLPLTITVPPGAPPGGHYAAVLVGTKRVGSGTEQSAVSTSQVVSSLMFLRVDGDVTERAQIRSFRSTKSILDKPDAQFELRIQNTGNVHVQPRGDIRVYNMWGQERGVIPVNRKSMFGNILPDSVRKYTFGWVGEWSITDIGRYKAETALAYGQNGRHSLTAETYFWVIPWKPLLIVLFVLFGFIWLVSWAIRAYVRRMLALSGVSMTTERRQQTQVRSLTKNKRRISLTAPLQSGLLDLRSHLSKTSSYIERVRTMYDLMRRHKQPLIGVLLLLMGLSLIVWFVGGATSTERDYSVTLGEPGAGVTLSSDELESIESSNTEVQANSVVLVNRSGIPGLAAKNAQKLIDAGYAISDIRTDEEARDDRTVIVYQSALASDALALSKLFDNALLSAYTDTTQTDEPIVIYLGSDQNR